ncbi:hypothetical protein KXW38_010192, partial [Aspergillus fumigatus]
RRAGVRPFDRSRWHPRLPLRGRVRRTGRAQRQEERLRQPDVRRGRLGRGPRLQRRPRTHHRSDLRAVPAVEPAGCRHARPRHPRAGSELARRHHSRRRFGRRPRPFRSGGDQDGARTRRLLERPSLGGRIRAVQALPVAASCQPLASRRTRTRGVAGHRGQDDRRRARPRARHVDD